MVLPSWVRLRAGTLAGVVVAVLLAAIGLGAHPAAAATVSDCTQWGTTSLQAGEYIYQQNEWNSTDTQCASIDDSTGAWSMSQANFNLTTAGAPATYPSSYKGCHWGACTTNSGLPIQVSKLGSATTSWSTTQVPSGAYDVAYDIWFNSTPTTDGQPDGTEVMIWLNSRGGVQPFGGMTGTANAAGKAWNVWTGQQTSWKIISYVLQGGGTSFTNLDVKALIDDAVARGSINPAHYLIDAEAGFEIWQGGQGLATNSFSFSASAQGTGGDTTPPSAPANLAVSATTSSSASLSWSASTDDVGVTGYDVYRGSTLVGTTTSTSFTDTGLAASTPYSYTVKAKDAAGNVSAASNAVTATTQAGSVDGSPPSAPANLAVSGTTSSSASLTWSASTDDVGVTGYDVYRGSTLVGTTTSTSFTDTGLAASTPYSYTVKARDAAGNVSAASNAVTATTQGTGGTGALKVQYKNNDTAPGDNQIKPGLQLVNTGTSAVSLSTVTVRYWFTSDGGASTFSTYCDYAAVGCGSIAQSVSAVSPARTGADHYLQVSFTGGSLAAGAASGDIQSRLNKADWSAFDETNDYSHGTGTSYADAPKITVYVGGTLVYGTEP